MKTLKKLALLAATALVLSTSAMAQNQQRHNNGGNNNWVGPAIIAGIIGYGIAQSQPVYVEREARVPVYVERSPVHPKYYDEDFYRSERYMNQPREHFETPRVYEDRYVWDPQLQGWRRVSVRIR